MLGAVAGFSVDQARAELARVRPLLAEFVVLRADAAELANALAGGPPGTVPGGVPELKGSHARLDELIEEIGSGGAEVKGVALSPWTVLAARPGLRARAAPGWASKARTASTRFPKMCSGLMRSSSS